MWLHYGRSGANLKGVRSPRSNKFCKEREREGEKKNTFGSWTPKRTQVLLIKICDCPLNFNQVLEALDDSVVMSRVHWIPPQEIRFVCFYALRRFFLVPCSIPQPNKAAMQLTQTSPCRNEHSWFNSWTASTQRLMQAREGGILDLTLSSNKSRSSLFVKCLFR